MRNSTGGEALVCRLAGLPMALVGRGRLLAGSTSTLVGRATQEKGSTYKGSTYMSSTYKGGSTYKGLGRFAL